MPVAKRATDIESLVAAGAVFYGVKLGKESPFVERNLARLEKRFEARYIASVEKAAMRSKEGKPPHQTTLRSLAENKERLETTKKIRQVLLEKQAEANM